VDFVLRLVLIAVRIDQGSGHRGCRRQRREDRDDGAPAKARSCGQQDEDDVDAEGEDDPGGHRQRFVRQDGHGIAPQEGAGHDRYRVEQPETEDGPYC